MAPAVRGKPMRVKTSVTDLTRAELRECWQRVLHGTTKRNRHHSRPTAGVTLVPNSREPDNPALTCWKSSYASDGTCKYPRLRFKKRNFLVHHIALAAVRGNLPGEIGRDAVVSHECGNHWCCRPDHLEVVRQSDNFSKVNCAGGDKCAHNPQCKK